MFNRFLNRSLLSRLTLSGALAVATAAGASAQAPSLSALQIQAPTALGTSTYLGHLDAGAVLHVALSLKVPNQKAFEDYADSVSDPANSNFRKYLSPQQIGQMFGPSAATVNAAKSYLQSQGFKIKMVSDSHLNILAECTVAQAEAAFHTTINRYRSNDPQDAAASDYFSFSTVLQAPAQIAGTILSVSGLESHTRPVPRHSKAKKQGTTYTLTPAQTAVLYDVAPLNKAGFNGQNRTCAISSFGGFQLSNVPLFYNQFKLPVPSGGVGSNITVVPISGGNGGNQPNFEADLDIQMVLGQAPLCNFIIYDGGQNDLIGTLTQEAQDNRSDIISESYGWNLDASNASAAHNIHVQMTTQGITYLVASGDTGTDLGSGGNFTYPDYDPEVLNVGGTVPTFDPTGKRTSEVTWSGSGGGWVTSPSVPFNVLPKFQKGKGVPTNIPYRLVPDVALAAFQPGNTAYYCFFSNSLTSGAGTSFASPVFCGAYADVEQDLIKKKYIIANSQGKFRMGRIADIIYKQNGRSDIWFDITSGPSNGTLPNGQVSNPTPFWDFITGWGAIDFAAFDAALTAVPPQTLTATSVGVYGGQGINPTGGPSALAANDGLYYSEQSVGNKPGAVAAAKIGFTLNTAPSNLSDITITFVDKAPSTVSSFIYLYNVQTQSYDLITATAMNGSNVQATLSGINAAKYVDANNGITMVVRGVNPTRLGSAFTLKIDQAVVTESF